MESVVPAVSNSASIHQKVLASSLAGHDALKYYERNLDVRGNGVIDLDIEGIPPSCDEKEVKKIAQVKHVVSTELNIDNFKGTCRGQGRIRIRLNDGESLDKVKENFAKAGLSVREH